MPYELCLFAFYNVDCYSTTSQAGWLISRERSIVCVREELNEKSESDSAIYLIHHKNTQQAMGIAVVSNTKIRLISTHSCSIP